MSSRSKMASPVILSRRVAGVVWSGTGGWIRASWAAAVVCVLALGGLARHVRACSMPCPAGWELHGARCYLITRTHTDWFEAAAAQCRRRGGALALPASAAENDFLFELYHSPDLSDELLSAGKFGVWLGCRRDQNSSWDCTGTDSLPWANWKPGEEPPSQSGCLIQWRDRNRWDVVSCSAGRLAACSRPRLWPFAGRRRQCRAVGRPADPPCAIADADAEVPARTPVRCCAACTGEPLCRAFSLVDGGVCRLSFAAPPLTDPALDHGGGNQTCVYYEMENDS